MRFTIDLTKNSDLTEFNRLIIANEGSQESTYELLLEDIILKVEQSGLISTKPQRIKLSMWEDLMPPDKGRHTIQPLNDLRFKHLNLIKHIFNHNNNASPSPYPNLYLGYLTYQTTHEIIKGVEVIVNLLKRNHKLKAFI
jgi:hypothetical protein